MAGLDHGFKIIANKSSPALVRVAGLERCTLKPIESTLQATTERLADRAFLARREKERFIIYLEFVTSWSRLVPWSILSKSGLLSERERLPVESLVFILQPRRYRKQNGTMNLSVGGRSTQQVWFHEICLWEIAPEPWWEVEPGLMALYPLCRHGQRPEQSVLHAAHQIETTEKDALVRGDLLTSLGLFSRLAYPGMDALTLIGREK